MAVSNKKNSSKHQDKEKEKLEKLFSENANGVRGQSPEGNKFKKPESIKNISRHRIWSRFVVILGVIVYIWYTAKDGKETSLAKQKEVLQQRGQSFPCDNEYLEEIESFSGCVPAKCGRHVSDKLVTANEADVLLKIAQRGISLGGSDGGASILDLHSGALSYGQKFINIYSLEESKKIFNAADLTVYKVVKSKIQHAIAEIFQIDFDSLHLTHPTFFSRLTNLEPKTEHDEYWHVHVDKVTYESFHYTSLLYLTDYGIDFDGGRLIFLDGPIEKPTNNVTLEPRKGRVSMFTSGAENVHRVEKVTKGTRYAITVSFTCDVSKAIKDPSVPKS
ncbi:hypothetical protein ILUMI_00790 [Ignelater luminosus]|uniref:Fe2OG dioxygenase domain-containing protein n=1 Tax=Ignelater luminosus TaxID=2038154 RepID=A0A8K0GI26_IGNLU|nr:hypothetical protein ILUMI_00790 [Ignelater luminosus]